MLNVGVHGAGGISKEHIKSYISNPNTTIIGLSDIDPSQCRIRAREAGLKNIEFYIDYDRMIENKDIDIISICTPPQFTSQDAIKAIKAEKHILIEKPIAIHFQQLQNLFETVRKSSVKTCVSFVVRWNPLVQTIKNIISNNFIGEIYYLETDYYNRLGDWYSGWEWARKKETGMSASLVGGIHGIDLARWFAGKEGDKAATIEEVTAISGGYSKGRLEYNLEYDPLEVMLVKFDTGVLAKIKVDFDALMPYRVEWSIFGDKGTIKTDRIWSRMFTDQSDWIKIESPPLTASKMGELPTFNFQGLIDHFINCIVTDTESPQNLKDALNSHEAALAAIQSYENNTTPIPLSLSI